MLFAKYQYLFPISILIVIIYYSHVQKSWNEVFFKILEEPSIVQKKLIPHIKGLDFSQRWSKKKIQNGWLRKFKMAASKKPRFPAPPILNIFLWNFYGLVLGLVELIDAKGIQTFQPPVYYSPSDFQTFQLPWLAFSLVEHSSFMVEIWS